MRGYKKLIDPQKVPAHVAIIMDGNGRWADKRGLSRTEGHRSGAARVEPVIKAAIETGIKAVSLYAFSTENWTRPKTEILSLWKLLDEFFKSTIDRLVENGVRITHSGIIDRLPGKTRGVIRQAVEETRNNSRIIVNLCLNYGSRQEIVDAANRAINENPGKKITEAMIEKNLYTSGLPGLDLLIRTSGETRVSNFLLWQLAYSELVFVKTLWPDFGPGHLYKAVYEYQSRIRRFGGL